MQTMVNNCSEQVYKKNAHKSSFRDPGNQVYKINHEIYRQINQSGYFDYQQLMQSGLYDKLQSLNYLIPHREVSIDFALDERALVVLKPDKVAFISYCYEWSFSQFKDAALLTLAVAKLAIQYGMILKDASAYNIQFHQGKPIFIDTGSFTIYEEGTPWSAYNQFCKHFLAPLLLMAKVDIRLGISMKQYIDGIPLDFASQMLPFKSKLSPSIFAHIHAHAKLQQKYGDINTVKINKRKITKLGLLGLLDNLNSLIKKLEWSPIKTEWGDYYNQTNYSDAATKHKAEIIKRFIGETQAKLVWDMGGNNGFYSRIISSLGAQAICFDIDPVAVETNYQKVKKDKSGLILPLLQDLTNPSPALGWEQNERCGLQERANADLVMALALIHHLAISNNVPLERIAEYFSNLGEYLIIEFVPKEDSQVHRLLASREDIFPQYEMSSFKKYFSRYYHILEECPVLETCRTIFLMKKIK